MTSFQAAPESFQGPDGVIQVASGSFQGPDGVTKPVSRSFWRSADVIQVGSRSLLGDSFRFGVDRRDLRGVGGRDRNTREGDGPDLPSFKSGLHGPKRRLVQRRPTLSRW